MTDEEAKVLVFDMIRQRVDTTTQWCFDPPNPIIDDATAEDWAAWQAVIDDLDEVYQDEEPIPWP